MCSIFGCFNYKENIDKLKEASLKMKHRGPDNSGYFFNEKVFLAHNRLAIIDLDEKANQPFVYEDLILVFNGEIYNFKDLRENYLKNHKFKTNSDTETILLMYKEFGKDCVKYLRGMFAFCIYDKKEICFFVLEIELVKNLFFIRLIIRDLFFLLK